MYCKHLKQQYIHKYVDRRGYLPTSFSR